jgi:hypothetical protein
VKQTNKTKWKDEKDENKKVKIKGEGRKSRVNRRTGIKYLEINPSMWVGESGVQSSSIYTMLRHFKSK